MRALRHALLLALLVLIALPAAASATEPTTRADAKDALQEAQDALDGKGVRTGREVTPALARLAAGKSLLGSTDKREANALLARPTDGAADPQGSGYTVPEATPVCTASFCVHYVTTTADAPSLTDGPDANTTPDYVDQMGAEFEFVRSIENGATEMAWQLPKSDGSLGGGTAKTDVYIKQIGNQGIYGYAAPEQNTQSSYAYLVMDDDYSPAEFPSSATPQAASEVTAAHEYNHVLQFNYDSYEDTWMLESSATWAEEQVYPAVNDYLSYLPTWASCTTLPLTSFDGSGTSCQQLKVYGSAVWNHWLTARSDRTVVRKAWENSVGSGSFAPGAYGSAISQKGGAGFTDEFNRFSAAVAEWRAPGSAFPDGSSYPDVTRTTPALAIDGSARSVTLDHTTFRLIDVTPDASKAQIRLHADLPAGESGAIALVGRTGSSPTAGTVTTQLQQLPSGGSGDVTLASPGSYGRITAVLANADVSKSGYGATDWLWSRDAQTFANVGVSSTAAPPAPATAAPATSAPAPTSSAPAPAPVAPIPALAVRLALRSPQKLSTVFAKGVGFRLRCNRGCRVRSRLRFAGASTSTLRHNQTLATVSSRLSTAGVKTVYVKLTRRARAALRGKSGVKVTLTLVVTPSSGTPKTIKRTVSLRR